LEDTVSLRAQIGKKESFDKMIHYLKKEKQSGLFLLQLKTVLKRIMSIISKAIIET
jgi:hypothetical protein